MAHAAVRYGDAPAVGRTRPLHALLGDERLVEQVCRGSHAAFEALYERHHRGLLAFCRHMLGSAQDAEEAVQQTFTAAYADLRQGDERPAAPKPWLYGVARHRCLAILRRRRVEATTRTSDEPATPPLADEVERRSEVRDLLHGVNRLPEPQRTALVLFGLCGHPQADVAAVIGCDEPRVRALVYQARSSLLEDRRARETPCHEIREKLALGRGGALRRRAVRRHVKFCPSCAEFRAEVLRQRRLMALAPQVDASLALKAQVLAAVGVAASSGGGAGAPMGSLGLAKIVTAALVLTATPVGGEILLRDTAGRHAAHPRVAVAAPEHSRARASEGATAAEPPVAGAPSIPAPDATAPARPRPARGAPRRPARVAPAALVPPSPVAPGDGSSWPEPPATPETAAPAETSPAPAQAGHEADSGQQASEQSAGGSTGKQKARGEGAGSGRPGEGHQKRNEGGSTQSAGSQGPPAPSGGGQGQGQNDGGAPATQTTPTLTLTVAAPAPPPCPPGEDLPAGCPDPQAASRGDGGDRHGGD